MAFWDKKGKQPTGEEPGSSLPVPMGRRQALPAAFDETGYLAALGQGGAHDLTRLRAQARDVLPGRRPRVLLAIDATGSMAPVWAHCKEQIARLLARLSAVGDVRLCWLAYRDYCDGEVLACSGWTAEVATIRAYMGGVLCAGGGGNCGEALEQALRRAVEEEDVSSVILIGDEPPHRDRREVERLLQGSGHKLPLTDYRAEAARLAELRRPVYAFPITHLYQEDVQRTFSEIAEITGGKVFCLDQGFDELMDLIGLTVAHDAGGEAAVRRYVERFGHELGEGPRRMARLLTSGRHGA